MKDYSKPFIDENGKWAIRETGLDGNIKIIHADSEKDAYKIRNKLIVNVDSFFDSVPDDLTSFSIDSPKTETRIPTNFEEKKKKIEESAKMVMATLMSCYFSVDIISKKEYLKVKAKIDSEHLSSLMFTLQNAEYGCFKILEQIDLSAEPNVKLFEVLCKMQTNLMDIVKVKTEYTQYLENHYKRLSEEDTNNTTDTVNNISISLNEPLKIKGTRDLIVKIKEDVLEKELDDTTIESQKKYDPRNKKDSLIVENTKDDGNDIEENTFG